MAYTPVATEATEPTDDKPASTAAAEFRAIKAYLNGIVAAGLPAIPAGGGTLQTDGVSIFWGAKPDFFSFVSFT